MRNQWGFSVAIVITKGSLYHGVLEKRFYCNFIMINAKNRRQNIFKIEVTYASVFQYFCDALYIISECYVYKK